MHTKNSSILKNTKTSGILLFKPNVGSRTENALYLYRINSYQLVLSATRSKQKVEQGTHAQFRTFV